jgi:hypothetical protein
MLLHIPNLHRFNQIADNDYVFFDAGADDGLSLHQWLSSDQPFNIYFSAKVIGTI